VTDRRRQSPPDDAERRIDDARERLNRRLRAAFVAGAEEDSLDGLGAASPTTCSSVSCAAIPATWSDDDWACGSAQCSPR